MSERQHDLYSGHLYVFVSRRGDRLKILIWSSGGFLLLYKRLERGRFRLPKLRDGQPEVELDATQFAILLDGIDIKQVQPPRRWTPPARPKVDALHGSVANGSVRALPDDHHCPWREEAESLRGENDEVRAKLAAVMTAMESLERRVLGPHGANANPYTAYPIHTHHSKK